MSKGIQSKLEASDVITVSKLNRVQLCDVYVFSTENSNKTRVFSYLYWPLTLDLQSTTDKQLPVNLIVCLFSVKIAHIAGSGRLEIIADGADGGDAQSGGNGGTGANGYDVSC